MRGRMKRIHLAIITICATVIFYGPAHVFAAAANTDPVAEGMVHLEAKRNAEAYRLFKELVEKNQGGADALYMLGYLTETGIGTHVDLFAAASLYRQAWKAGSTQAEKRLAKLYEMTLAGIDSPEAPSRRNLSNQEKGKNIKEQSRLLSGGMLSAITGDDTPGHFELTRDTLKAFNFSEDAIAFVADASQDPDLYHWGFSAAHAQRSNNEDGRATEDRETAIKHFQQWSKELVRLLDQEGGRSTRKSLYAFGYMIHAVQDLASHRGITDAQHSYASYIYPGEAKDCDHDPENLAAAGIFTKKMVERLRERRPAIYTAVSTYTNDGAGKLASDERADLFGRKGTNLTFSAYHQFEGLAKKYKTIRNEEPFRPWRADEVFNTMLELL